MSPEQARGRLDVDHRSDLWSLGIVVYRALTGRRPFEADNMPALMLAMMTRPIPRATEINPDLPGPIDAFFAREVTPYVADAWINRSVVDDKDHEVGRVGYEINFNRYFYRYTPPRPLEEIEGEIRGIEQDILRMLAEVTGGPA